MKIGKCFACWSGYPCVKNNKLPRKKKKRLLKFYDLLGHYFNQSYMIDMVSSCTLASDYKALKPYFHLFGYYKKNKEKINFILKIADEKFGCEPVILVFDKGGFTFQWVWEDDNGLYCTEGSMPFIYEKAKFDKTWSGSETEDLLRQLGIPHESVKNDRELIQAVNIEVVKQRQLEEEREYA
jgi:hypothetical protein